VLVEQTARDGQDGVEVAGRVCPGWPQRGDEVVVSRNVGRGRPTVFGEVQGYRLALTCSS
jgi:hypothetical protein